MNGITPSFGRPISRSCHWTVGCSLAFAIVAFALPTPSLAAPADEITRAMSPGGAIRMELSAGGYTIRGTDEGKIRVHWSTRNPDDMGKVRVDVDVNGSQATIRTDGPHSNFQVEIDVPSVSNLWVRLSAGDMRIAGVEGNKDVQLHAGNLTIGVGNAEQYANVDASVQVGGIDAPPFHQSKGGFWRSFRWEGSGKYRLHAHVGAGNLEFTSFAASARRAQDD